MPAPTRATSHFEQAYALTYLSSTTATPGPAVDWLVAGMQLVGDPADGPGVDQAAGTATRARLWSEPRTFIPLPLSATTPAALATRAGALAAALRAQPELDLLDVSWTLTTRPELEHRVVVDGADCDAALAWLDDLAAGKEAPGVAARGTAAPAASAAFVFPGQGSQWLHMAVDLLDSSPVFAAHMAACAAALSRVVDWSLIDLLRGDDRIWLDDVEILQPVLWAVLVSLADLWRAHGVEPAAVVGHSQGEVGAACAGGGLSLVDGAFVAAIRARVGSQLAGRGGLLAVGAPAASVAEMLAEQSSEATVAVINSVSSTVVSGTPEQLDALAAACKAAGIRSSRIPAAFASHTAQVDDIRDDVLAGLAGVRPSDGDVTMYSTVTAAPIAQSALDAEYWFQNLRRPVLLAPVIEAMLADGVTALIEVSPRPVLTGALEETANVTAPDPASITVLGTLRRGQGDATRFGTALAQAWVAGLPVDWAAWHRGSGARLVELPTFGFQ